MSTKIFCKFDYFKIDTTFIDINVQKEIVFVGFYNFLCFIHQKLICQLLLVMHKYELY